MNLRFAALIIYRLGTLGKTPVTSSLTSDPRFKSLSKFLQHGSYARNPQALIHAFAGMESLGLDTKSLDTEFKWVIRKCSIKMLARLVEKAEGTRGEIALEAFHRRWIEVTTGGDFIVAFKIAHMIHPDVRTKLEDKCVETVPQFSSPEILKVYSCFPTNVFPSEIVKFYLLCRYLQFSEVKKNGRPRSFDPWLSIYPRVNIGSHLKNLSNSSMPSMN